MRAIITGAAGLIGSNLAIFLLRNGWDVIGVDNDCRSLFFGSAASTITRLDDVLQHASYKHVTADVVDHAAMRMLVVARSHCPCCGTTIA